MLFVCHQYGLNRTARTNGYCASPPPLSPIMIYLPAANDLISTWNRDGTWGRASNMSWYYSHIIDSGRPGECFWLDHRGDLKHKKDLEEDYIGNTVKELNHRKKEYPKWLWASEVLQETGTPVGNDLTDGMRENGVQNCRVPLGVKFHAPQFTASKYGDDFNNLTISDFVDNPARIHWIMEPMRKRVRGGNPVLPILVSKT